MGINWNIPVSMFLKNSRGEQKFDRKKKVAASVGFFSFLFNK